MLERIQGVLREKGHIWALVDVGPITLRILGPTYHLPNVGERVVFWTYLTAGESLTLYGFQSQEEREVFLQLLKVPGIGPQTALRILTQHSVEEIHQAVEREDIQFFSRISGVGKKRAVRILSELKGSLISKTLDRLPSSLVNALIHLGLSPQEARDTLLQVLQEIPDADEETLLRKALQKRSPS